jgi:laccase
LKCDTLITFGTISDVYNIDVVPGKTYLLRIVNAALNTDHFFSVSGHKLTVVEADGEYIKPFVADHLMLGPGQTANVLLKADQTIDTYQMAIGPYVTAKILTFQNITSVAHFRYSGADQTSFPRPATLPFYNDSLIVNANMDALKSLAVKNLPLNIDENLFFTIGLNVEKCNRENPNSTCQGPNGGIFAASMNNISFTSPNMSLLQAYYNSLHGIYTDDFPGSPMKIYDFVNGAPNIMPNDTNSVFGTRVKILEYGAKVQLILQDTGTVTTESHPMHLHGYSFYVVGYGSGNYNPTTAKFNLVDPPLMNTINVPVGGWAAIRFVADNPGMFKFV